MPDIEETNKEADPLRSSAGRPPLNEGPRSNFPSAEALRRQVSVGPMPDWVVERPVDWQFRPDLLAHQTIYLSDHQHHAERRQQYHRRVSRLHTLDAVQEASRFQLDFDPLTQQVQVHGAAVWRGGERRDQARVERLQILHRESALEAYVLHGWATLLLLLEDVQVDDVIDVRYTITTQPKLLPERFQLFELVPLGLPIGEFHLEVRFAGSRPMRWKAHPEEWTPEESQSDGLTGWHWQQKNLLDGTAEAQLPAWFLSGQWIQITDCQRWEEIISACVDTWPLQPDPAPILDWARQAAEAARGEDAIEKAIAFVQDQFRYLSFGGQVPSAPSEVLRRHFGDCKDLSCLLAVLLRAMGIVARPVLVHAQLTGRVASLLPMMLFNHAIVEFEVDNERRWVDPARKLQGGGTRRRPLTPFRFGLPIEAGLQELREMPDQGHEAGAYKLRECFWLNTAGPWSVLEIQLSTTGAQAELFRNLFAHKPEGIIARQREQFYGQMFPKIKRLGKIACKDDRALNEFTLSETYEIAGALYPAGFEASVFFSYASHLVQQIFRQPLHEQRRYPCALPFPYSIEHVIDVDFSGLQTQPMQAFYKKHPLFLLSRKSRASYGFHATTFVFETFSDSILPDQFDNFKATIDEVWPETMLFVNLPEGVPGRRPKHLR